MRAINNAEVDLCLWMPLSVQPVFPGCQWEISKILKGSIRTPIGFILLEKRIRSEREMHVVIGQLKKTFVQWTAVKLKGDIMKSS